MNRTSLLRIRCFFCRILICIILFSSSTFPTAMAAANTFNGSTLTVNNGKEYYKAWSQDMYPWRDDMPYNSSTSDWMNRYGCCVVAMAKLIVEAGLQDPDTFNPGTLISTYGTSSTKLITGDGPSPLVPTKYGFTYEGSVKTDSSQINSQVLSLLNSDAYYYGLILKVTVGSGTHFVHVDREKTLETGTVYINDSMSYDKGNPSGNTRYTSASSYWNMMAEKKLNYAPTEIRKYRLSKVGATLEFPFSVQYYERAVYKGSGAIKKLPYAGTDVEWIRDYESEELTVVAAVKNKYDNIWYQLEGGGYIYSGDVSYVKSLPTFSVPSQNSPSGTLTEGKAFYNTATITSSDSLLQVSSGIYQGSTAIQGPYTASIGSSIQKTYELTGASPLASKLKFGSLEPGSYTYKVTVWYGKHGLSKDVIVSDFTVQGSTAATYALNLSGQKDGVSQSDLEGIGTVDVYINGALVADDATEYSGKFTAGTSYEFTDIKAKSGFEYAGLASGSLSGVINSANIETTLTFNTVDPLLEVSGLVDGVPVDSLEGVASFDVYVDDSRKGLNRSSYSDRWPSGSTYLVNDIVAYSGYEFNGVSSGAASGIMGYDDSSIVLSFSSIGLNVPWTYADHLPADVTANDYTIQYQNIYYKDQPDSPGSEWSLVGSLGTEYVNDGDEYVSYYELETSETRVLNSFRYFHVCSGSTGESIWFEANNTFVHWDTITDISSVYVAGGPYASDADANLKYYKLKWNDGSLAYCGTSTCSTSHAKRSCYWYKRYVYQDRIAVTTNRYMKYGAWQDSIDPAAGSYTVRYKPKNGVVTQIILPETVIEMDYMTAAKLPAARYTYEGQDPNPDFIWEIEDSSIVWLVGDDLGAYQPGITYLYCSTDPKYGNASTMAAIIVGGNNVLTMPDDLTTIEAEAFIGAKANEVNLLDSNVRTIGSRAFADCSSLRVVRFPDSITEIAEDAFDGCDTLYFVCESYNYAAQYAIEHDIAYCCLDFDLSE